MESERDLEDWRRRQRERLIAERRALDPRLHRTWSAAIEARLAPLLKDLPGDIVGLYWPHRGEVDPRPLAPLLIAERRRLGLPAVAARGGLLEYRAWQPGAEMEAGHFGIPAPKLRDLVIPAIVLVPLVGFDAENHRLGYGGGYFDRTLAALAPRPLTVGVGFAAARLDTVLPQPHDIALDIIVTETGLYRRNSG